MPSSFQLRTCTPICTPCVKKIASVKLFCLLASKKRRQMCVVRKKFARMSTESRDLYAHIHLKQLRTTIAQPQVDTRGLKRAFCTPRKIKYFMNKSDAKSCFEVRNLASNNKKNYRTSQSSIGSRKEKFLIEKFSSRVVTLPEKEF